MPNRLSGNDDDDEDNDDHGANNLILAGNFSYLRSKQDHMHAHCEISLIFLLLQL